MVLLHLDCDSYCGPNNKGTIELLHEQLIRLLEDFNTLKHENFP